uniref:Uncharacterized protein n=1 Tax=candidate division CPR3 bacterium TaxID=2268181 RepID=A0A7C4R383_UNCC3
MKKLFLCFFLVLFFLPKVSVAEEIKSDWPCFGSKEEPRKFCVSDNPDGFFDFMNRFYAHGIKIGSSKDQIESKLFQDYLFQKDAVISGKYRKYTLIPNTNEKKDHECLLITLITYLDRAVSVTCANVHKENQKESVLGLISKIKKEFEDMYGLDYSTECELGRKKCNDPDNYALYMWPSEKTDHFVNIIIIIYKLNDMTVSEYKYILDGPGFDGSLATKDQD